MRRNLNNVVYICYVIRNQLNCSKCLYLVHSSFSTHVGLLLILAPPPHFPSIVLHVSCDEHFKQEITICMKTNVVNSDCMCKEYKSDIKICFINN
jgi:hypothetical protein